MAIGRRPHFFALFLSLLILIIGEPWSVIGQHPDQDFQVMDHYTVQDGLSSNKVYRIFQDQRQQIWAATGNGLSRFDGRHFQRYTTRDGIIGTDVYWAHADHYNRVWYFTNLGSIGFIDHDSVHTFVDLSAYKREINQFYFAPNDTLYVSLQEQFYLAVGPDQKVREVTIPPNQGYLLRLGPDQLLSGGSSNAPNNTATLILRTPQRVLRSWDIPPDLPNVKSIQALVHDSTILLNTFSHIWTLDPDNGFQYFQSDRRLTASLALAPNGNLLYGLYNQGLHLANFKAPTITRQLIPPPSTVTAVFIDQEESYWFSTMDDGIYRAIYSPLRQLASGKHKVVRRQHDTLYSIGNERVLYQLYRGQVLDSFAFDSRLYDFLPGAPPVLSFQPTKGSAIPSKTGFKMVIGLFIGWHNDRLIKGYSAGAQYIDSRQYLLSGSGVQRMLTLSSGELLIGTDQGLYIPINDTVQRVWPDLAGRPITDLDQHPNNTIAVSSFDDGVFLAPPNLSTSFADMRHYLPGKTCLSVHFAGDSLLVGTHTGLVVITGWNSDAPEVAEFGRAEGFPAAVVQDLSADDDFIYLATTDGLFCAPRTWASPNPKQTGVRLLRLNGQYPSETNRTRITLPPGQSFLEVSLSSTSYRYADLTDYRYRINGGEWIELPGPDFQLRELQPGDYDLEIQAGMRGAWEDNGALIQCSVLPEFWQTNWFWALVVITLSGGLGWFIRWRFNQLRARQQLEISAEKLRNKALSAQLNPHFLFNTLGSIQSLIVSKEASQANNYLTRFSHMLRRTLNHSDTEFVSLADELELINNYFSLEQMRFQANVKLTLTVDLLDASPPEMLAIPPMLIQPLVENAFKHAFPPPDGREPQIEMSFRQSDPKTVRVMVQDNGSGTPPDIPNATSPGGPHALGIITQRLASFRKLYHQNFDIWIESRPGLGTTVQLDIPCQPQPHHAERHHH